jgi:branched-chain amino acid transport system substrate-binding protein
MALGFYNESALQRRQATQAGLNVPFVISPGAVSPDLIKVAADQADGIIVIDYATGEDKSTAVKDLAAKLKTKYNEVYDYYVRNGYDMMNFVITGLEKSKEKTRSALIDSLHSVKIDGLLYPLAVDKNGEFVANNEPDKALDYFTIKIVKGGQFVLATKDDIDAVKKS